MSIPLPGTYRIRNIHFPNQMFDLQGGSVKPDTPVIGFANNHDSQNMLWTLQVVDASKGTVRLINVASGTIANRGNSGSNVVGSPSPALLRIAARNNVGEFSIQTTDGELACSLAKAENYTQVTLQRVNNNDAHQGWLFCPP